MKVYNYGSINIDHIYRVSQFVKPGETLSSNNYQRMLGGKGANQSIALAKAGLPVKHIGRINTSDNWIIDTLSAYRVDSEHVQQVNEATGHALIQVTDAGENAIILYGGANQNYSERDLSVVFNDANQGDWLLLQNECNLTKEVLTLANEKGLIVAFNPAPMTESVKDMPLDYVDYLIVNEVEAEGLVNDDNFHADNAEALLNQLHVLYSNVNIVMTLGSKGVMYKDNKQTIQVNAEKVKAIDTTAAGDTFIGYFIQQIITGNANKNNSIEDALKLATKASSITVQTLGASDSIPEMSTLKSLEIVT